MVSLLSCVVDVVVVVSVGVVVVVFVGVVVVVVGVVKRATAACVDMA